jgi:hypothetical protein
MSRASLQAFRKTITVDWRKNMELEGRDLLLKTAARGHAEIMASQIQRAGIPPDFSAYANRPGNNTLSQVVLPGPIVYSYDYRREIVSVAWQMLIEASPSDSGEYASSHTVYLNGMPVEALPAHLTATDQIVISNPVPYARRLEVGKTKSGSSFVIDVEPHIYERVVKRELVRRYGNLAKISFNYVTLPDAWVVKGGRQGLSSHYTTDGYGGLGRRSRQGGISHLRKRRQRAGEKVRAPAIIIEAYR